MGSRFGRSYGWLVNYFVWLAIGADWGEGEDVCFVKVFGASAEVAEVDVGIFVKLGDGFATSAEARWRLDRALNRRRRDRPIDDEPQARS